MNEYAPNPIVELIGRNQFHWLAQVFDRETRLKDVPGEILQSIVRVNVTTRDYSRDRNAVTAIALVTFAYRLAGKVQHPQYGSNDIMLSKILARSELSRREGGQLSGNPCWDFPLYEIITGEVGDRIRATKFMTNPM
jgi:hypothetical protein